MEPVLADEETVAAFARDGVACLRSVLDPGEVAVAADAIDAVLARRWSEGTFTLDSILAWSAVCAGGVDTVPLAGDTSEDQIARIIGDVSWLAFKWNKPLGVRLMVAAGKNAGDMTAFTAIGIVNTRLH